MAIELILEVSKGKMKITLVHNKTIIRECSLNGKDHVVIYHTSGG